MISVTDLSPSDLAARAALPRPSSSLIAHWSSVTSLRCIGLDRRFPILLFPKFKKYYWKISPTNLQPTKRSVTIQPFGRLVLPSLVLTSANLPGDADTAKEKGLNSSSPQTPTSITPSGAAKPPIKDTKPELIVDGLVVVAVCIQLIVAMLYLLPIPLALLGFGSELVHSNDLLN
ncbi:unnamed protein product [Leptidea sinapis]|uniref:Uncharacterized protein n=1 Tax=Leptidea sinapis TaxID=189913 RepID=A0A5E4PLF5_9NEOP|nr:unnamed protein product [Leptidea sinapis]